MILYPNLYCKDITEITIEILRKNNIKGLILDVDNTLIDYHRNLDEKIKKWVKNLKKEGIKFCILSNSNNYIKVKNVADELEIPYFYFAKKPLRHGFLKAQKQMNLKPENIAAVGDQIMTDIIGANRCNMFSILVEPIDKKDIFITKIHRPIENHILKKYIKNNKKEN